MFKRIHIRTMICMVLALAMVFDIVVIPPAEAKVTKRDVVLVGAGAAAGAGLALAAPAIGSAVAGAGGILGGVVGGLASVVGGVIGVGATIVGGIGSAIAAVGGWIAGLFTSSAFIPALVIVGAAVAGYYVYKKYKEKKDKENTEVIDGKDIVYVSPTDYEMSNTIPEGDDPVSVGNTEIITIGADAPVSLSATDGNEIVVTSTSSAASTVEEPPVEEEEITGTKSLEDAYKDYIAAYQRYTALVTNSGGADQQTVTEALQDYQKKYNEYITLKAVAGK